MRYLPLILFLSLFGCTRKLHTTRTQTSTDSTAVHRIDSLTEVISTLSEAYESLLQTSSTSEVTFDTTRIGGAGMPHIVIMPDGTREITGPVKSFKDNSTSLKREVATLKATNDSLRSVKRSHSTRVIHDIRIVDRKVTSHVIPWWIWLVIVLAGGLWAYERFVKKKLNP